MTNIKLTKLLATAAVVTSISALALLSAVTLQTGKIDLVAFFPAFFVLLGASSRLGKFSSGQD